MGDVNWKVEQLYGSKRENFLFCYKEKKEGKKKILLKRLVACNRYPIHNKKENSSKCISQNQGGETWEKSIN